MANWNTSNYHQRKAQRLAKAPAQWVQNPDTQEWFYLRPVGAMASLIAGMLPAALTGYAAGQKFYLYTPNLDHLSNDAENFGGLMTEINICPADHPKINPTTKACSI